jgi:hypothetical protein
MRPPKAEPITDLLVKSRNGASWVNLQKRNWSSSHVSNQVQARTECECRLHDSANHTLISRKFNEFMEPLVSQVNLWAGGIDERKLYAASVRALRFQEYRLHAPQQQVAQRASLLCRLRF